jgi:hypothetical protein
MTESTIISKVWNFANVLRDDGVGYGDYLEQITYLLFLKMADELNKPPYSKNLVFPRIRIQTIRRLKMEKCAIGPLCQAKEAQNWKCFTTSCYEVYPLKKEF